MSNRREADMERFAAYLSESGWLFPDGRAVLVELLGVGVQEGETTSVSSSRHSDADLSAS